VLNLLRARLKHNLDISGDATQRIWESALDFGTKHRVTLLLYDYIMRFEVAVPESILKRLKMYYRDNAIRNIRFEEELKTLKGIFDNAGTQFILLKGIGLSQFLYYDTALRPCSDADILISPSDLPEAEEALKNNGYNAALNMRPWQEKIKRQITHQWPFFNPCSKIYIEVHTRFGARSRTVTNAIDGMWLRTHLLDINGISYQILCPEDMLLFLVLHSTKEFFEDWLQLYDIAALVMNHPDLDWQEVYLRVESIHCRRRLKLSCVLLMEIFQTSFPPSAGIFLKNRSEIEKAFMASMHQLFQPQTPMGLWSSHTWRDLKLADRWRDRFSIVFFKSIYVFLVFFRAIEHLIRVKK